MGWHNLLYSCRLMILMSLSLVSIDDVDRRKRSESKDHPLSQWFTNFSEADELLKLTAARQQVIIF